jgi:purine-nucleoside phosphorylase
VKPGVGVVLGSGLGEAVAADVKVEAEFPYAELPGFPAPSAPGHPGTLLLGELFDTPAAVFMGRIHYYEGHGIEPTTLITRVAREMGATVMILTNAAGGLDPALRVGQFMLIEDHLNFLGVNPLAGWRFPGGAPAFVDLSTVYDARLIALAEEAARGEGVEVARGTYAAVPGPSYETPAETTFLARSGARAVGMSTVPEAVAAAALGMAVLGISCITDVAGSPLSHEDVLETATAAGPALRGILRRVVPGLRRGLDGEGGSGGL